jgi:hypothetical protein
MTEEKQKQLKDKGPNYFGDCPECKSCDGFLNIGRTHVFYCDEHETQWTVGSNLFSSWHGETEEDWESNAKKLAGYREVEPYTDASFIAPSYDPEKRKAQAKLTDGDFAIKYNNCAVNDPCDVCGDRTDPDFGPELFRRDSWGAGLPRMRGCVCSGAHGLLTPLSSCSADSTSRARDGRNAVLAGLVQGPGFFGAPALSLFRSPPVASPIASLDAPLPIPSDNTLRTALPRAVSYGSGPGLSAIHRAAGKRSSRKLGDLGTT